MASHETLKNGRMLRVDRDDLCAAARSFLHDQLARADERLLVGQRNALSLADGRERRPQTDHTGDRGHNRIGCG